MTPRRAAMPWLAAAGALAAMAWSAGNGFVYDDIPAIVQNVRVTDPHQWHTIATSPYWLGTLWRPVTTAFFAAEWWTGAGSPLVFHFVSLTAYLALTALAAVLLLRLGQSVAAAGVGALWFAVHPTHVEVVANVVGQSELWTALALCGVVITYVSTRRHGFSVPRLLLLLALATLAIGAKEQGFAAVLLCAGAECLLLARTGESRATRWRLLVPLGALTLLLFVVRSSVLGSLTGETPAVALQGLSLPERLVTFLAVTAENARLIVWPWHLQADYGPPGIPMGGPIGIRHVVGALLVVAVIVAFIRWHRTQPVAALGIWWAAVTIAPVSNLLTPSGLVMAERALFLPSIGLAMVLAAGVDVLLAQPRRTTVRLTSAVAAAWIAASGVRSAMRNRVWHDQERFFTSIVRDAPRSYRAWKVAGEYRESIGDHPAAIAELQRAIALWPHDYHVNERLGQVLRVDGNCARAVAVLADGVHLAPQEAGMRAKLVECLIVVQQWDAASRYAEEGVRLGQEQFREELRRVDRARARPIL